jgi:hypothetical protein
MRDWHSGGETGNFGVGGAVNEAGVTDFDWVGTYSGTVTHDTLIKHGGVRSIKFDGRGYVEAPLGGATGPGLSKAYGRWYIYPTTAPAASTAIAGFWGPPAYNWHDWGSFVLRPDMRLEVRTGVNLATLIQTSGWAIPFNQWSRLELFVDTVGVIQAKFDGGLWCWAGFTPATGPLGLVFAGPWQAAMTCYVDDMAVNSTVGPTNSSWCGPGEIHMLVPGKDYYNIGWLVQPSGSVIDVLNDLPGPVDDANYVYETAGVYGAVTAWRMTEMPVSGAVSSMLWGVRGGSTVAAPLMSRLDVSDSLGRYAIVGSDFDLGVNGWKTVYPAARAESTWDGTGRMLSASSPFVSHQAAALRITANANPLRWAAMWCNVEVAMPMPLTAEHPTRWAPRSLMELITGFEQSYLVGSAMVSFTALASLPAVPGLSPTPLTLSITTAAALTTAKPLAATPTLRLTTAATLLTQKRLVGAASLSVTTSADLLAGAGVAAAVTLRVTTSGALLTAKPLVATATMQVTAVAALTIPILVTATVTVGITTTASVTTAKTLVAAPTLQVTSVAALTTAKPLATATTIGITAVADLSVAVLGFGAAPFGGYPFGLLDPLPGAEFAAAVTVGLTTSAPPLVFSVLLDGAGSLAITATGALTAITWPYVKAQGTISTGVTTGAPTVTIPAHIANDILIVVAMAWAPTPAAAMNQIPTPSGWALVGTQAKLPTAAATADGWVGVFWRRATGAGTTVTLTRDAGWDTGNDTCYNARAYVIGGCITTGDPWDATATAGGYTAANQAFPAVTVSGAERTVVIFGAASDNLAFSMAATGWTIGTEANDAGGTDSAFQTAWQENVSSSTAASTSTVTAPAAGGYGFIGVSFK